MNKQEQNYFLYVFENGDIRLSHTFPSEDDFQDAENGYLDIIRMSDRKIYIDGKIGFVDVPTIGSGR